jgi:autotransporter-associated beta strand protein
MSFSASMRSRAGARRGLKRVAYAALGLIVPSAAAGSYYFDLNGVTPGSGASSGTYVWSAATWSTDGNGAAPTGVLPSRQTAIFSAGTDALFTDLTLTGPTGETASVIVQEGNVTIQSLTRIYLGSSVLQTYPGTTLTIENAPDFYNNAVTLATAADSTLTLGGANSGGSRRAYLTKTGAGRVVFQGANIGASGGTLTLNAGEFLIRHNASLPDGTTTVNTGGTLALGNSIAPTRPFTLAGGTLRNADGSNTCAGLVTLTADSFVTTEGATTLTFKPASGDAITGAFNLSFSGAGAVVLSQPLGAGVGLILTGPGSVAREVPLAAAQTWTGVLAGPASGRFVKQGGGGLTLAAANPFAGSTTIAAGTLALAASASLDASTPLTVAAGAVFDVTAVAGFSLKAGQTLAGSGTVIGAVSAASGSVIAPGSADAPATLTFAQPLVFAGGVTAVFDLATTPAATTDRLVVTGNLTLTGTNTIRVIPPAAPATLANGTYPLIRNSGGLITGAVDSLQLDGFVPGAQIARLQLAPGGAGLDLVVAPNSYTGRALTWVGNAKLWDTGATANWRVSATAVTFTATDRVTFDSTGAASPTVLLTGSLAPAAITVNASTEYTFSSGNGGALIGPLVLTKAGSGRLVITGDHSFSGGTTLSAGSIEVRSSAALGTGPVANSGTLVLAPAPLTSQTVGNAISGSGALTHGGGGVSTLAGVNSFSGPVAVTAGTLRLGHASALGSSAGATTVHPTATLDLAGFAAGAEPLTLAGGTLVNATTTSAASIGGVVTLASASTIDGDGALTLSGAITGSATLTKAGAHTLTLSGDSAGQRTGTLAVAAGRLVVTGHAGAGPLTVASGATLGGTGTIGGPVTIGGALDQGAAVGTLTATGNLTLQPGATARFKITKTPAGLSADALTVGGTLALDGALSVTLDGLPLVAGDTVRLFSAGRITGAFAAVTLPYLYNDLIWDRSAFASTGVLRVITLPAVSTQEQRREWVLSQAAGNPGAIDGSVMAAAYFARGDLAQGRALALSTSRSVLANHLAGAVQVHLFDIWPALDLCIRYGAQLDAETHANIKQVVTTFTQYKDTNTANLQTLAWTVRYLGGEFYGEAAFTSLGIANYWRTDDANARAQLRAQFASRATTGYPEFASRPYFWKDLLPFLSIGQLAQDPAMRLSATLSVEAGFAQYAGNWMRGHLGLATGRSYPDVLNQFPVTSLGMLWFYFGGEIPARNSEAAVFTAVMNQPISPIILQAAADRSTGFRARSFLSGMHQSAYTERDYVLFSDGPLSYGNFQVYPNGVVWCEPDLSRYSFLWVAKPWRDDAGITVSNPHGRNTTYYKEAQSRDAALYIYNIPATGDACPYALGYVPGGHRAVVNESAASGQVFLHYGTVLIAIRSENSFNWDPASGIAFPASAPAPGDSEFRIYGTQFAVALETASPADHPGATPAEQLAAFRAAVLARPAPVHLATATPTARYTSRRGDTLEVALSKVPSTRPVLINGLPVNYNLWPMLENPWMYQRAGDPLLTLASATRRELLDFTSWTRTVQTAPATAAPLSPLAATAGQPLDIDLAAYVFAPAGSTSSLRFSVAPTQPARGTLALQADGHTVRFTPTTGYRGPAAFSFTARTAGIDPAQLVFHYDYEAEDLGDNLVADHSGHRLDAAVSTVGSGSRSLVADVPPVLAGVSSAALQLDEATTTATRLTHALSVTEHDLNDADWTFATWVRRATTANDDFIFYLGSGDGFGGSGDELYLYFPSGTSNTLRLQHYSAANVLDLNLATPATATAAAWHHVAVSFTRTGQGTGVVRLYLNGALTATSVPVTWTLNQSAPLVIGGCTATTGAGPARWLNGRLDDTALFNRVLPADEIARLATQSVAHFTGLAATATIDLSVRPPLEAWRQTHFGTTDNTGAAADSADADGDGASNLLEYALGTTPTSAASVAVPAAQVSGLRLALTFQRFRSDVTYAVEASSDLLNWTTITTNPGNVGQSVTVTDTVDLSTSPRRFLRLRVTTP